MNSCTSQSPPWNKGAGEPNPWAWSSVWALLSHPFHPTAGGTSCHSIPASPNSLPKMALPQPSPGPSDAHTWQCGQPLERWSNEEASVITISRLRALWAGNSLVFSYCICLGGQRNTSSWVHVPGPVDFSLLRKSTAGKKSIARTSKMWASSLGKDSWSLSYMLEKKEPKVIHTNIWMINDSSPSVGSTGPPTSEINKVTNLAF